MNLESVLDRLYHAATHGDLAATEQLIGHVRDNAKWNAHANSLDATRLHRTLEKHGHIETCPDHRGILAL